MENTPPLQDFVYGITCMLELSSFKDTQLSLVFSHGIISNHTRSYWYVLFRQIIIASIAKEVFDKDVKVFVKST